MATLIDSSLWIDFTRAKSPQSLKQFIAPYILSPDAVLAEPVIFEVLRYATDAELPQLQQQFSLLPTVPTPANLWGHAADLGRSCRKQGVTAGAMDLLIVSVAVIHGLELLTFDGGFLSIASSVSSLRLKVMTRPTP